VGERLARGLRGDGDLFAATVLVLTGLLAGVGGVAAVVTGHVVGGRPVGILQTVYGVALLCTAWQVTGRLSWGVFLVGAPLLLLGAPLVGLLYQRAGQHWWPTILEVLVVIGWARRLIWRSRAARSSAGVSPPVGGRQATSAEGTSVGSAGEAARVRGNVPR